MIINLRDQQEVINCAPNQYQWLWISNHPRQWEWSLLLEYHHRLVFSSISNSIESWNQTYHVLYNPSVTYNYQGEKLHHTILRQWSQYQVAERRNLHDTQPQRLDHWADCVIEDRAALLHKTKDTRGQQQ